MTVTQMQRSTYLRKDCTVDRIAVYLAEQARYIAHAQEQLALYRAGQPNSLDGALYATDLVRAQLLRVELDERTMACYILSRAS